MVKSVLTKPLRFYQKYLTLIGFGCCRYYPTCSEYAKWQIETNPNLFSALFHSLIRILRCNQLFDGGIDYPKISCTTYHPTVPKGKILKIDYWFVPESDGCRVIKNTFSKGPMC